MSAGSYASGSGGALSLGYVSERTTGGSVSLRGGRGGSDIGIGFDFFLQVVVTPHTQVQL